MACGCTARRNNANNSASRQVTKKRNVVRNSYVKNVITTPSRRRVIKRPAR